jgi:CheY-like chemotaxis protein
VNTVLIIDDSKFLRVANERLLTKEGYLVIAAHDGEEALHLACGQLPNLIILDMLLPKLAGEDVLRQLKSNVSTSHIPVIVLSGMSQRNEEKLKSEGAAAFLEKGPLLKNPRLLLDAVKQCLKHAVVGGTA